MRTAPLKHLVDINRNALAEDCPRGFEFRYVDISTVGPGYLVAEPQILRFEEAPSRARRLVNEGDTIISTVRTYLRAVLPISRDNADVVVSTGFAVLSPRALDRRYLGWLARSSVFIEEVVARSVGVSYPAISPDELGRIRVPAPSTNEQRIVADFLDAEVSRIDEVYAARTRQAELLRERFWALVSHLTGSGTPTALRRCFTRLTDGPFGSAFSSSDYVDEGVAVVRLGNIGFAEYRHDAQAFVPADFLVRFARHSVTAGELLIAGLGDKSNHAGRACVAPELGPAIVKGKCLAATVNGRVADADFLAFAMSSPHGAEVFRAAAQGSTRSMINLQIVKSATLPLPAINDQRGLARRMQAERTRTENLLSSIEQGLFLLTERKNALLNAAVTGQLELAREIAEEVS